MGWAIKRPNGTYRAWNANAQDDRLQPGELWEARDTPPPMPIPPSSPNPLIARIDSMLASTDLAPNFRALLIVWKEQL